MDVVDLGHSGDITRNGRIDLDVVFTMDAK